MAARLWQVDVELARLDGTRAALLAERQHLLGRLRASAGLPAPAAPPGSRSEWTPRRVQNVLLVVGGVLLAVAAAVFAAVSYDRLGASGRAAVLLTLTALSAVAAPRFRARRLEATAETVAAVALALGLLDAWGLRRLGLGADLDDRTWLAAVALVLGLLAAGYAAAVPLRVPRLSAVVLGNAAVVLAVARLELEPAPTAVALAALSALDLLAVTGARRLRAAELARDLVRAAAACATAVAGGAGAAAVAAVALDGPDGAVAVGACAALAACAAALAGGAARVGLAAGAVALTAATAVVALADRVSGDGLLLVALAGAAAGVGAAVVAPARERRGPVLGAALVTAAALVGVAEQVVTALLAPFAWAAEPWTLPEAAAARAAVSPHLAWTGSAATLGVLVAAAALTGVAGRLVDVRRGATAGAAALVAVAVLLVPVALDLPHPAALVLLVAVAVAALAGADSARAGDLRRGLATAGAAAAALAVAWSLADRGTTLAVLPAVAVLASVASLRARALAVRGAAAGVAGVLVGAELTAIGAARGLAPEQVGGLLLLAPAALVALSATVASLGAARRSGLDAAAALVATAAVVLAVGDPGWLSWTLAAAGVVTLGAALRPDRRRAAPAGALLVTASSWVRLADAGVDAPEPYVLPVAALVLLLGHLRFRRDAAVRSQAAYGPGLALLLGPSVLAALAEDGIARPLLVGAAALGIVLLGARVRLQAPLVIGSGALAVVALDLLAPYASAVPRWTALAAAGTVLVVVGATFEQRRRQVADLRDRVTALR